MQRLVVIAAVLLALVVSDPARAEGDRLETGAQAEQLVTLEVTLTDGSRVVGKPATEKVSVETDYAKIAIPLNQIASVTVGDDRKTASIVLRNGDNLAGKLRLDQINLEACFGSVLIPLDKLAMLKVDVEEKGVAKFDAAADFSGEQNPNGVWSYGWCAHSGAEFYLYRTKAKTDQQYPGLFGWTGESGTPSVAVNRSKEAYHPLNTMTFEAGQMAFHPGPAGECSVIRWTAPRAGRCRIKGAFTGISGYQNAPPTTTDVAVYHGQRKLFSSFVNLEDKGNQSDFDLAEPVEKGDVIDFVLGFGNGNYGFDSTGLEAKITLSPNDK